MPGSRLTPPESALPPVGEVRGLGLRARLAIAVALAMALPILVAVLLDVHTLSLRGFIVILASVVASAAFVVYLAQQIIRPLRTLTNDAHALAAGVAGHRSAVDNADEIGELAAALNRMAETVEKRNAALADSERRYRFLFDSNPLPMWAWDADTLNILAANEAATETYGYDREQFLSLRITDILDPVELERFGGARLPFSESRQNAGPWLHRTATGRKIEMEVVTTSSRRLGRASWLSVGIDVTARRAAERALARSEDQLRQAQKMEAIGTFAGGISHDFSNLLTGMLGYCDLMLAQLPADASIRDDVNEIRSLAIRGTELTRQVLAVSRRQVLQPVICDPNHVVDGLDRLLRRLIGEHIELVTRADDRIRSIRADVAQLEQVLLNLVSNARDAMPNGGRLEIETARLSPAECARFALGERSGGWIAIRVRDNGSGMSPEVLARVFEPFFTTKPHGKGTGLGLSLASSMIDQIGGEVRVDSTPGFGTTVQLLLPHLDEAVPADTIDAIPESALRGSETILLAEDEETVRTVVTAALERRGYRVLAAANGETALAISRAFPGPIHLLVTDVVMPGMSGRELAEQIERTRPSTAVLFVSGYTDDEVLLQGVSTDARTLLQKPFTALEVAQRVRSRIDSAKGASVA